MEGTKERVFPWDRDDDGSGVGVFRLNPRCRYTTLVLHANLDFVDPVRDLNVYENVGGERRQRRAFMYGFVKEIKSKYKRNAEKILKMIESVYRWIPLGTIIDKKVLVVHGGISDITDLECIKKIERQKYVSLLRPPLGDSLGGGAEAIDKHEWKQVFDLLWSDPQGHNGCIPNSLRGAGTYFGPDVTKKFLEKNKMLFLIRSHECKPWGYEMAHDDKVITIFSASNYYETGSNKGAYLKLTGSNLSIHFIQFTTFTNRMKKMTFRQRVGLIESSALRELSQKIISVRHQLMEEFKKFDSHDSGKITTSNWCTAMENSTGLRIPWRMLKEKLVMTDADTGKVMYATTFQDHLPGPKIGKMTVVETLYRNKTSLEAIFRIIDKDNSGNLSIVRPTESDVYPNKLAHVLPPAGYITLDEFSEACSLLSKHIPNSVPQEQLLDICRSMDMNKDGQVDLNEFLETFRLVDIHREVESPTCDFDDSSSCDGTTSATTNRKPEENVERTTNQL
ncbi:hypothetical protein RUM44_006888 [Polyplax serrata]|uniref:EF-hand domain-containing protein n=1 Tax=Polyplax serrata TaxID=468196 RepID=A0ABR1AJE8_POLSC